MLDRMSHFNAGRIPVEHETANLPLKNLDEP